MKVSLVIPVYNEEQYIGPCLDSLLNQEEPADEIIIVDNNSTDNSVAIAKSYGVIIVHQPTQGITHARSLGFETARYDIIARCDADSRLPPFWIKKIKENFTIKTIDALSGPYRTYDGGFLNHFSEFSTSSYYKVVKHFLKHEWLNGSNMALTKKIWQQVKKEVCLEDKVVHEDLDLAIHIARHGVIAYDPTLLTAASSRRLTKHPFSALIEYQVRSYSTLRRHHII